MKLFMQNGRTAALAQLASLVPQLAPQAAALEAGLAASSAPDRLWQGLQLWLTSLLSTWGKAVYQSWAAPQSGPGGVTGLLATLPVHQLLYGEGTFSAMAASPHTGAMGVPLRNGAACV